ncbi:MAG: protein transport protein bet1 [Cirrosporium novae-zelandiae]|nr:MAG: protein transport protein bet1 [Cirrosporium novae-zelandiae]
MASRRFGPSALHQRDPRSSLFENYSGDRTRPGNQSPGRQSPYGLSTPVNGYRPATPNKKGQYSDAVLSELESQNEEEIEGISAKVKMLKDLTVAIGDEIRDSSALAEKMNDTFDSTRVRLRGTMNRMLRMAERSGVSWKAWLAFFCIVIFLFWYVWLF